MRGRRVLRQYSKSELEAVVAHATRKESVARAAYQSLWRRFAVDLAVVAATSYTLGGLTVAAVWWWTS